jgi:predicted enzyme related to lactoylglutathione lyase
MIPGSGPKSREPGRPWVQIPPAPPFYKFKWLTVVFQKETEGTQLLLEPNDSWHGPAAKTYQEALFKQSIPAANFFVDDIQKEYERMKKLGVRFTMEPTKVAGSTIAVFDDACGNLIQITQLVLL